MTEADPIRVYCRNGEWVVDYGSYAQGLYVTRGDAIKAGTDAARPGVPQTHRRTRRLTAVAAAACLSATTASLPRSRTGGWARTFGSQAVT